MGQSVTLDSFTYTITTDIEPLPMGWDQMGTLQIHKILTFDGTTVTLDENLGFDIRLEIEP